MKDAKGHGSDSRGAAHRSDRQTPGRLADSAGLFERLDIDTLDTAAFGCAPYGRKYVIRDGSHRYAAAEAKGRTTIRAKVS